MTIAAAGFFDTRQRIYNAVQEGRLDQALLTEFFPSGQLLDEEAVLWDYKITLPNPLGPKPSKDETLEHGAKLAEVVKDAVAFYNSYGGYLVAGIDDKTRDVVGYSGTFDTADLNQKIQGATGVSVETVFRLLDVGSIKPGASLGILYIPKRPFGLKPAQFKKNAPENAYGKKAYSKDDFYLRERDRCIPSRTPEDFEYLYSTREVDYSLSTNEVIDNNLPSRDQEFTGLIGRDEQITKLWSWLSDGFSPIKILSGLGGVGKTSIAYSFAERLIFKRGTSIDRIVWLGAKVETFSGELNRFVATSRTDFATVNELLVNILLETGCPKTLIADDISDEHLLELCSEHLSAHRYLLLVDNVDSMKDDEQQLVFHLLTQVCSSSRTKCIITARRNLGAHRAYYIEVEGFGYDDFVRFVEEKANLLQIKNPIKTGELQDFWASSGGSPLFTLSVLRLMMLGDTLRDALKNWRGSDGEAVRDAAFRREIGRLKRKEASVLLALCHVPSASAVQLSAILNLSRFEIQEAIDGLRAFSMMEVETDLLGGSTYSIPATLALVRPLVESRVTDHDEVAQRCAEYTALSNNKAPYVGEVVTRAIALLATKKHSEAISLVRSALSELPEDGDLLCLLGRCYQESGNDSRAKDELSRAFDLGCRKRELFTHWTAILERQEDWSNLVNLSEKAYEATSIEWFRIKQVVGKLQLGDALGRGGNYPDATRLYEESLNLVIASLRRRLLSSDRSEFSRLRSNLALRWLGAVRMSIGSQMDDERRMFGAYFKAITVFKLRSDAVYLSTTTVVSDWTSRFETRKTLSDTARDYILQTIERLNRLISIVDKISATVGEQRFVEASELLIRRLDNILVKDN